MNRIEQERVPINAPVMENRVRQVYSELRPYQQEAIEQMRGSSRWLMCDDMGLGKTVTCLTSALQKAFLYHVYGQSGKKTRLLVLCGTNAMGVWREECEKWFNMSATVYAGTPKQREKIWKQFVEEETKRGPEPHVLITTYAMLKELPQRWLAMFCDEYHQAGIMNCKTQNYRMVKQHAAFAHYLYLMTGTPIRQGVIDLFAPLHLVDNVMFSSYWGFVNKYCIVTQTPFGKQIERNPANVTRFREILKHYLVRRRKSEVLHDLPGKQRNAISVRMTTKQRKVYNQLAEEMMYVDADTALLAPNQMTVDLRLRQLLVTPRLLGIDDDGAGFNYLSEVVPELLRSGRPCVIFTPFRQAVPMLRDLVEGWNLGTEVYTLTGGVSPAIFADTWQGFQRCNIDGEGGSKVLICVIKSGASFHATSAADCFFLGYEWDFNLNVQAEDRLCRLGQQNFVQCNYLVHEGDSVDDLVKARLNEKQLSADFIIGSEKQFKELLRRIGPQA